MNNQLSQTRLFATSAAGSGWWFVDALYRHGPSWQLVPPLLLAVASLIGALNGFLNGRQARKHADELHRAEMARINPFVPKLEKLH